MGCLFLLFSIISLSVTAAPEDKAVAEFFKDKTKIANPIELRDPFKSPALKTAKKNADGLNAHRPEAKVVDLETVSIADLKVTGVLIGKERRAAIRANEKDIIFVKEGTKIGPDKAEVKAILPGGIVLVEKIVNVYGQEEYLETVIPISK